MSNKKLRTGWEGINIPDDFKIPSCGIVDMDRAMFNLFDKDLFFRHRRSTHDATLPTGRMINIIGFNN